MYKNLRRLRREKDIPVTRIRIMLGLKTDAAYYKKEKGIIKFSLDEALVISNFFKVPVELIFAKETEV